jgi:HAD superfamily hydrolase (TIGR01509 family)
LPALKKLHLLDYFEFVLTVREVGKNKTHPDIFLQCAERLGATVSESTVFEDSLYAAKTAKNAGFKVCAVYDVTNATDEQSLSELCDIYIHSFEELL